jgi:predicted ABC-type ATPase
LTAKTYAIIAGINGAGKSTFYRLDLAKENPLLKDSTRVNSDEILRAQGGNWRNKNDQFSAGKETARKLNACLAGNSDFHRETTLAGGVGSYRKNIRNAKNAGFLVYLIYVSVCSAELAKERVKNRVSKGGHGIPDEVIEKRYSQSLSNLREILPLVDEAEIYENSNSLELVYYKKGDDVLFNSVDKFSYLEKYVRHK